MPIMGLSGVEPLTSRLSGVRSNHLSYRPYCPSLPIAPRPLLRPKLLVLFVVELVVQIVVFVEVLQLLVVETVAATLERPVRRLTGQHCHPQLRLRLMV